MKQICPLLGWLCWSISLVSGETEYDNYYYVAVSADGTATSRADALTYCEDEMGTSLASIHNDSQNANALDAAVGLGVNVSTNTNVEGANAWIGLSDQDTESTFVWSDGTTNNYDNWYSGSTNAGSRDCAALAYGGQWEYLACGAGQGVSAWVCNRLAVPQPSECYAYWIKNPSGSDYVQFSWSNITIPDGDSASDYSFYLGYKATTGTDYQYFTLGISTTHKDASDFDYSIGTDAVGGTIQVVNTQYTQDRLSVPIDCTIVTSAPTEQPTPMPTDKPTKAPSSVPTMSPTWDTPYLYIGGDICATTRCGCGSDLTCVGEEVYTTWQTGSTQFVTFEQRVTAFGYPTLVYFNVEYLGATNSTENISMSTVDSTLDTGYALSPSSGYLNVSRSSDGATNNGKESMSVTGSDLGDTDDYDIYLFRINLTNCSIFDTDNNAKTYDDCDIVYPSSLYVILDTTIPATETTTRTETEIEGWTWWLIFGLAIFLGILAFLIYRFWFKNRQKNKALSEKKADLDQAIEEAENGFGADLDSNNVQYNPMATGMQTGARAGQNAMFPNGTNATSANQERTDVTVEKFAHKSEFGQVQPRRANY